MTFEYGQGKNAILHVHPFSRHLLGFALVVYLFLHLGSSVSAAPAVSNQAIPGRMQYSLVSELRHATVSYDAFLPIDAQPGERFPAVYLLHGAYEDGTAWAREMADILPALATRHRLVLIAPSAGSRGWYVDSPFVSTNQVESFILRELIPNAEAHLPISQQRGVLGISMGGHGALTLALRHPDMFVSASSMSGVLDITRHPEQWGIKTLLGPLVSNRPLWERHSALYLLERFPAGTSLPALLVTTGTEDTYVLQDNRAFHNALQQNGSQFTYRETRGIHDWEYWRREIPQHLAFHGEHISAKFPY